MNVLPTQEEVRRIASTGKYKVIPVSCEILSDFTTPIETLRRLKNVSMRCYMLESAYANETRGRYTFLGFDPIMEIRCADGEMTAGILKLQTEHPSAYLRQILSEYKSPCFSYLPPFTGGLAGYFSYDYFGYSEASAKGQVEDTEKFPDVDLMLFDKVIAFDHFRQKIILIVNMKLQDVESEYNKAVMELKQLAHLLKNGEKKKETGGKRQEKVTAAFGKEQFCDMVQSAKNIFMKEIFFRSYYRICYQRLMREASSMLIGFLGQRILLRICFIFQEQILRWQALHRKHWLNWRTERFIRFQWQERDQEEEMRRKIKRWKKNC